MNRLAWLIFGLGLCRIAAADWQEELTSRPGNFPLLRPLHAHYNFGWGILKAAEADFNFTSEKGGVTRLAVTTRSTGAARLTWRMDSTQVAVMRSEGLRPLTVRQEETYDNERLSTRLDFDANGVARLRESQPPDKNPPKRKRFDFPQLYDLHSALHFVRSQRLTPGDTYKLVVYPATAPYLAEVKVTGRTRVRAAGKTQNALQLELRLWRINNRDLTLQDHDKFKRATIWISDDPQRLLLRLEAEIFIGKVWGELESVEWK